MARPDDPPQPVPEPRFDPVRERLRQFEESRGLPPSLPDFPAPADPAEPDPVLPPAGDDAEERPE